MRSSIIKIQDFGVHYTLLAHLHVNKTDFGDTKYSNNTLKDYCELLVTKYAGSHFRYRHTERTSGREKRRERKRDNLIYYA